MYYCYILYSKSLDRYYIGSTADLYNRLAQHNSEKRNHYTSTASDWELKYQEGFPTRSQARKREMEIKRKKSRKYIEWLIKGTQE